MWVRRLNLVLPKGVSIFADKAYTDYELEDFLHEALEIAFIAKRKANAKRKHDAYSELKLSLIRNRIETVFSEIKSLSPRSIRAKTEKGFSLKIMFFILAYTVKLSLNHI